MPARSISVTAIIQTLEAGVETGEILFFPEVRPCEESRAKLISILRDAARHFGEGSPAYQFHRRTLGKELAIRRMGVSLSPSKPGESWTEPVALEFDIVYWKQGDQVCVAFVPSLGIEVIAPDESRLWEMLPDEIRHELQRSKQSGSLLRLALLQRVESTELEPLDIVLTVKSPRQREEEIAADSAKAGKPVIEQVGETLDGHELAAAHEADAVIAQLADVLAGRHRRSVLLVGPSGVGKTAAVHELVRRKRAAGLSDSPFWATNGSRLIAGMSGFGMWQERCQKLCREAVAARAILHLGSLVELMEVGKGEWVGQGVAGFLRPYLGRGDLLAIAECTPEQLPVIERHDPHLLEVFVQIRMPEPTIEQGRAILRKAALSFGSRASKSDPMSRDPIAEVALENLDRLHRRYASYSAYPGRPLRFLKNLLHDRRRAGTIEPASAADVTAAFSRETGLPLFMLDDATPLNLPESRQWFAQRVIGQEEAVDLVADLLATVKSGLNRPRRPIASLLFIGPTGVGKTEMAKSLAEFFFGDPARMTRFDMSEYANPAAVARLVGGVFGTEGLLTSKVREQPFCVVLLDEFEKADPSFFDLLLQVLGDGRLTDAAGRVADFSNAIVVMTSNLGAESFQQEPFGLSREGRRDARRQFVDSVRDFLRPEMFNRIDRIVPFLPLDETTVLKIVRREIELLERRDGFRLRSLQVRYSDAVVPFLARQGYDPLYGARPLKRAIERQLLAPLSDGLNGYGDKVKLTAGVEVAGGALAVTVRARAAAGRSAMQTDGRAWVDVALMCATLRREMQALERSPAAVALGNEIFAMQKRRARRDRPRQRKVAFDADLDRRLARLADVSGAISRMSTAVVDLEDRALAALYEATPDDPDQVIAELAKHDFQAVLLSLYSLRYAHPDEVFLAVVATSPPVMASLASAYCDVAGAVGATFDLCYYTRRKDLFRRHAVENAAEFLAEPLGEPLVIGLRIKGTGALPRFAAEAGAHQFEESSRTVSCLVQTAESIADYDPAAGLLADAADVRRSYRMDQQVAEEKNPRKEFRWTGRKLNEALRDAIEERLHATLRAML